MRYPLLLGLKALLFGLMGSVQAALPPIQTIKKVNPTNKVFKVSGPKKPILVKSAEAAANYFDKDALATLKKKVDFSKQFVLIFAWRGSGQDKIQVAVAESFPEQIFFSYKRGFTKDLRTHVHIYALRANVKWRLR